MTSACAAVICARAACASSGYLPFRRREIGCATGMLCCSATCLTGLGVSFMPRPLGRSGWVSTSGTLNPASMMADRARAAKTGVPAKITFMDHPLLRFALLFFNFVFDAV